MGAALVLLLVGLGSVAAGVLIGRYYVPDDRQLRRTARHSRGYMRALSYLIARDHDTVIDELRGIVEENVDDVEPYFALGALFRSRGEHERAIRVHQALAVRERDRRKLRQRAMYELGLDFRAAGMPRRATRAMEEVLLEDPGHEGALRALAALYEEQTRFNEAAQLWHRLGKRRGEDLSRREHHLLVAAGQAALGRDDLDSAKQLLKAAQKLHESPHLFAAAAELAAARDNHRGAKERLKQALIAEPALAPLLLPGLIAAERALAAADRSGGDDRDAPDELADDPPAALPEVETKLLATGDDAPAPAPAPADGAAAGASDAAIGPDAASPIDGAAARDAAAVVAGGPDPVATSGAPPSRSVRAPAATPPSALAVVGAQVPAPAAATPPAGVPLVPPQRPTDPIAARVLDTLAEIEERTGPRLELALIRAQLVPASDDAARAALARDLAARFPDALAARVATARLALAGADPAAVRAALEGLVTERGALAWALHGRWQCAACGHRPDAFSWRCGKCRRWGSLRMETGVEPPPVPSRDRRATPRPPRVEGLLGSSPDESLPAATLDPGLSEAELARAGARRSLLGRVGGWISNVWRRDSARS